MSRVNTSPSVISQSARPTDSGVFVLFWHDPRGETVGCHWPKFCRTWSFQAPLNSTARTMWRERKTFTRHLEFCLVVLNAITDIFHILTASCKQPTSSNHQPVQVCSAICWANPWSCRVTPWLDQGRRMPSNACTARLVAKLPAEFRWKPGGFPVSHVALKLLTSQLSQTYYPNIKYFEGNAIDVLPNLPDNIKPSCCLLPFAAAWRCSRHQCPHHCLSHCWTVSNARIHAQAYFKNEDEFSVNMTQYSLNKDLAVSDLMDVRNALLNNHVQNQRHGCMPGQSFQDSIHDVNDSSRLRPENFWIFSRVHQRNHHVCEPRNSTKQLRLELLLAATGSTG